MTLRIEPSVLWSLLSFAAFETAPVQTMYSKFNFERYSLPREITTEFVELRIRTRKNTIYFLLLFFISDNNSHCSKPHS
jgi:hypothetical protein